MFCNKRFKHYEAFFIPNSLLLHSTSPVLCLFLWRFYKKSTKVYKVALYTKCACLCCRAAVKMGLSFSAARPSDSALWDMVVEPGRGAAPNTVSVVCRRKVAVTAKRSVYCAYSAYACFHQTLHIPFVKHSFSTLMKQSFLVVYSVETSIVIEISITAAVTWRKSDQQCVSVLHSLHRAKWMFLDEKRKKEKKKKYYAWWCADCIHFHIIDIFLWGGKSVSLRVSNFCSE